MSTRISLLRPIFKLVAILSLIPLACTINSSIPSAQGPSNPVSGEAGTSRKNPIPLNTLVSIPGWNIKVMEFLRGENALEVIDTPDWQPDPLPPGQEYALAKIFVQNTSLEDDYQSLGISELFITGSHNVAYGDTMDSWPQPEFLFEDMFTAETVEGWIDAVIPTDEQDLMVVLDVDKDNERYIRYFVLQNGASISIPANYSNAIPNDLGVEVDNPAPAGQNVITPIWEITVMGSLRGQEAETILEKDNPSYSPPETGIERLLLKVKLHYINPNDVPTWVGTDTFSVSQEIGNPIQGSWIYLPPQSDMVWLAMKVLPGAELEGWVAINIPAGENNPIIIFDPDEYGTDQTVSNLRYLAVK